MLLGKSGRTNFAVFAAIILLLALTSLLGCSFKKPQSPSWITTWQVPISDKTYSISDLLEKMNDSLFVSDSLGNPVFTVTRSIDTFAVDNNLTYSGTTIQLSDSMGTIDLAPPTDQTSSTNIYDVVPVNLGVVVPVSFNYIQPLPAIDKFSWIDVETGTLDLTFYNGLEVDLDTFVVTVIDQFDSHTVGVATYVNGLSYLETETQSIDLSGQRISNLLSLDFSGHTPGGVLINAGPQNLDATASFPGNITVTAARAETPAINISRIENTSLTDSTQVTSSTISSGMLQIDVTNYSQIPFDVFISTLNFRTAQGNEIQINQAIAPLGTSQVNINLAGYTFTPSDTGGGQYIEVQFNANAQPSAPAQYVVNSSDSVGINATVSDIVFSSITGQIKPTVIAISPIQQTIDIPQGMDQARLTQAELRLHLYNNSMVPADIDLQIDGGGNSINVADRIPGKSSPSAPPLLTTITVGSQDLYDFLNPPPTQLTVSGQATMNPDYGIATVTANDYFFGDYEIYSPFAIAISDTVSVDLDINRTTIDPDSRPDDFATTFKYGAINVEFDSHLPLGVGMTMYIGLVNDSTLYTDPRTLILGPYSLQPGVVDSSGIVIQSVISTIADSLDNTELAIFDNDTLYFGQMINLLPTDSVGIQVTGADNINIRSNARIQLQVGENLWKNQ